MKVLARSTPLVLALFAGSSSVLFAQTVYVVDGASGAGSTHTTISAAVAAAVDGDFILVRAGDYFEELRLDGKGLTVQAEAGAVVHVTDIVVENLASNQTAAIRGIGWSTYWEVVLELTDNAGPVWIEDADCVEPEWWGGRIERCENVVLRNCVLGKPGNPFVYGYPAKPGLHAIDSTVALFECCVTGEIDDDAGDGGAGLVADGSSVTLYASTALGARGGYSHHSLAGKGGPGVSVSGGGVVDVIGSTVQGGIGGYSPFGSDGPDGPAYEVLDGTVNELPNAPRLFSAPSPHREGELATYSFTGMPGDRVGLLVASEPGVIQQSLHAVGPLVIPPSATFMKLGTLPASGTMTVAFQAPPVAGGAESYFMQGIFLRGTLFSTPRTRYALGGRAEIAIGTPAQVHVLDESY